ncbi:MAG: alpha-D-glucose phosphate-specific phosphoglucomutase [Deltaproteobacteria bacterium]|jgi:phosphoglucomutase|nr:alpha-D-glucose phosphate-specific phosphoglucomutase [Deltaproteobacteria bacterium]
MQIKNIQTTAFNDQRPGTAGLRKKTKHFMQAHYLENFTQSVLNAVQEKAAAVDQNSELYNKPLIIGGDGRFFNRQAINTIIKLALANGYKQICVAQNGILSSPAASTVIRARQASGGFILSASHNPGGENEDFGIKYDVENGGPAQEKLTERIFEISKNLTQYQIADIPDFNLTTVSTQTFANGAKLEVFDGLNDYVNLMQKLFDFDQLKALFNSGFTLRFDAMHAVTGPYAKKIFEEILGAKSGSVINYIPLEDFGGGHPDPNQVHARKLIEFMYSDLATDLGAASDGDGDRNLIVGQNCFVSPGDSLAIIARHMQACIPVYKNGLLGVARSMPTSQAVDLVAQKLGIAHYETPTGWKFFSNLMDANKCTICGEESFGTGSNHIREKDGLWAVLCWLSILAYQKKSVQNIVQDFWVEFGRNYYQRHDYEDLELSKANELLANCRTQLPSLIGKELGGLSIAQADDFSYHDPVEGSITSKQGIRLFLKNTTSTIGRIVFRLSGTGTTGGTLRIYYELYDREHLDCTADEILQNLVLDTRKFLKLKELFGKEKADIIT